MAYTAAQLLADVELTVDKQQVWTEALILEKLGFNWGSVTYVAAGEYDVVFQQPYATGVTTYEIWAKAFTSSGADVGFKILEANKTNIGFKVWVSQACLFAYTSTQPKTSVPL
jgi:hypothetical protein